MMLEGHHLQLVAPQALEQATGESERTATEPGCAHSRPARISWTRLLMRVFKIDLEHCPNCGMKNAVLPDVQAVLSSGGGAAAARIAIRQPKTL